MVKGFLKVTHTASTITVNNVAQHVTSMIILGVISMALSACGQKGALILPTDQAAQNNKAIYLITPKKANGEPQATPQTDFVDQASTDVQ
ncbi:MAG: hypothetical protein EOO68_38105 [Moraxellaceae bacterium]|nr:MAG: hypothetical protein EOO68_38105 [Moraxellaceae bacterium]